MAFGHYDTSVGANRHSFKRSVPAEPGVRHALDVRGTTEWSQWYRGGRSWGRHDPIFYPEWAPTAACGADARVAVHEVFDPEAVGVCPDCAVVAARGGGFRRRSYGSDRCGDVLRLDATTGDEGIRVFSCSGRWGHDGEHRADNGATWTDEGAESFTPPPDGFV